LIKLLAPFRWWIVLAVLLSFATVGSSVGLMAVSAYLISKAALTNQVTDLALAITGVRFFAITRAGFRYAERVFSHTATFRILTRLRVWFYQGIEPLAPAQLMQVRSGDLLARITADIETLENFYIRVVVPPLAAALVTALACLILGSFSPPLGVALLAFLLLTGVALPLLTRWLGQQPGTQSIAQRAELNAILVDQIQGMADLLAYGQEDVYQSRVVVLGKELDRLQERMALIRGLGNGLAALLTSLAALTVLAMAIPLVSGGQIDGVFLALIPLTAIASFEAVQPLAQAFQNLEASRTAADRIFDLLDASPEVVDQEGPSPQPMDDSIEVSNLSFRYGPDEPKVLDNVSFSVPSKGRVALSGPSGSGKSTLVHLLLRFWEYQDGHIRLGGHELRNYRADDVRRKIAVVSQQTHLFNTSIRDNLLLADADASDENLVAVCQKAQIHEFFQGLPQGYDTLVGENGVRLSGGERQRLAIARALLKDAPIIILDEATAHLDPVTERQVWQGLDELVADRTLLVISHRPSSLAQVDEVIRLERENPPRAEPVASFSHEILTKTP
jgi:ATP-binding cassette subfamily C protein CydC